MGDMANILLVHGRPEDGPAVESALEGAGGLLVHAASGEEALRRVLEGEFAVVLTAAELPDMSGLELARRIRSRDRLAPVIFLGAGADFPVAEAYALGAVDHLPAPLAPVVLRAKVAMFIEPSANGRLAGPTPEGKLAELARARLEAIVESCGDAIIDEDLDGSIRSWNDGARRIFGYAADEAIGRPITLIVPEDRLDEERGILERLRRGERIGRLETRRRRKDGRLVDVSLAISPIRDAAGRVAGALKVSRDITGEKAAEAALATSRARLDYAVRASGIGFWYRDLPTDEMRWDELAKAHFHLPADAEVTVDLFYERIHPDDREPTRAAVERSIADRGGYDIQYRTVDPATGAEKWLRAIGRAYYDKSGRPTRFDGVTLDITEQRRSAERLRETDERLKLLVDQARDYAVIVTDRNGRVVEWSGGAESITGHAAAEILGWPIEVIYTAEDRAAGVPAAERLRAARDGRVEHLRWHERRDGNQFFAEGVMIPLWGGDGALRGFGKVFRDVTDRKRAEEAVRFLADASASLAELVDYQSTLDRIANLAVGGFADWCVVDLIDEDGRRERLAVTAAESPEVIAARAADRAFRSPDGAAGLAPHALRTGEAEVMTDLLAITPATAPEGPDRLVRLRELGVRSYLCVPLVSRGRVIGGMTFLSSSTRRRFGPEELRIAQDLAGRVTVAIENAQLYRALQEQDQRKDEFLAMLAHELRNPLAPIRNGVRILRVGGAGEEAVERTLSIMDRQLGHITHLVDDLMDVARVSSGKVKLRLERAPLAEIVDAAVETSRRMIDAAGHELVVRMSSEPLAVEADRTRLVQVLANLLNNAAKYTPPGGRVELSFERDDSDAAIRIADNGVGIPPEMLAKVFEMFAQVGSSLERSQGGLGIGLMLVKRLVEMHGGSVTAESPGVDGGSVFTVRIPLVGEADAAPGAKTQPAEAAESVDGPLDVLVVDDNRDSAATLALLLELRGHRVKVAHDGPEALRLLAGYRPQLILLDLGLPGMSGYEVAHRIRQSAELVDVTLAALTGWGQEEDRRRTREAGFDHHLVKPAEPEEIDRIVQSVQAGAVRGG